MKRPSFQFYPADWLSSTKISLMKPQYEGAYIRLLCHMWSDDECSLPDDDEQLSVLSRLFQGWFNGGSSVLRKCFIIHPEKPGFLTHARLVKEREKQDLWAKKSSEGGKKSAQTRQKQGNEGWLKGCSKMVEPKPNSSTSSSTVSKESNINITHEEFWNLYAKKKGCKSDSEKKWKRLNNADRLRIMAGLPAYISAIRDKQYQPYPETFLNSREWENEEYGMAKVLAMPGVKKYTESDYANAWG